MIQGCVKLCSFYVDFNFGTTSVGHGVFLLPDVSSFSVTILEGLLFFEFTFHSVFTAMIF